MIKNNNAQVWVETVIYTLIALVLIALALAFVKPKVEEFQDKSSIERAINIMKEVDNSLEEVKNQGVGNKRIIEFQLAKGSLKINGVGDNLVFELKSRYEYSEPGEVYNESELQIITEPEGEYNTVRVIKSYVYNITYDGEEKSKTISKASLPYKISVLNKGYVDGNLTIDMEVV